MQMNYTDYIAVEKRQDPCMPMKLDVDTINDIGVCVGAAAEMSFKLTNRHHGPRSVNIHDSRRHQRELYFSHCVYN